MKRRLIATAMCICGMSIVFGSYLIFGSPKIDSMSVVGSYQASNRKSLTRIQLRSDGSYLHSYLEDGRTQSNTGTWSFTDSNDGNELVLSNVRFFSGEIGDTCGSHGGYCLLGVRSFLGKTSLVYDIDLNLALEKIPD